MKRFFILRAVALAAGLAAAGPASAAELPETLIFRLDNIQAVSSGPGIPTTFTTGRPWRLTAITTYHWNGGSGATPGTLALSEAGGSSYGPWVATGRSGQGGAPNVYWDAAPDIILPPGTYTVVDSDPSTWSYNTQSGGRGFVTISGHAQLDLPPEPLLLSALVYAVDGDPRITPVVWTAPGPAAVLETQLTIPAAGLGAGTHRLTFGAIGQGGTETGPWVTTFVRQMPYVPSAIGTLAAALNTDPLSGGGTSQIITPPAAEAGRTLTLPAGLMLPGQNQLHVRARDPNGGWGPLVIAPVIQAPRGDYKVAAVAMAVNTDPATGGGTSLTVNPAAALANAVLDLPPGSVAGGPQRLMVRARDESGAWGPLLIAPLIGKVIDPLASAGPVAGFELRVLNAAGQVQAGSVRVSVPAALPFEGSVVWPALRIRASGAYRLLAAPVTSGGFTGPWAEGLFQHNVPPFTAMMNESWWPPENFPALDLSFTGDTNADSLANGAAFAFGLTSESPSASRLPVPVADGAALILTFRQRSGGTGTPGLGYQIDGIRYLIEAATNPAGPWLEATGHAVLTGPPVPNPDNTDTVSVRITNPAGSGTFFVRLRVSMIP